MPKQALTMNQAFSQLEKIVADFETGNIDLENSINQFKQGLELAKFLKDKLKVMENEIEQIKTDYEQKANQD